MIRPTPVLAITAGDPAGIGAELIASLDPGEFSARLVIIGDIELLTQRSRSLGYATAFTDYRQNSSSQPDVAAHSLEVIHTPLQAAAVAGKLNKENATYVLNTLSQACRGCIEQRFDAMVTAPIQKEVINDAGIPFSGHTEYLAELCTEHSKPEQPYKPVMLLAGHSNDRPLRVALATTHLPLREVADRITAPLLEQILRILDRDLKKQFAIATPQIKVCGLNPHAGENGYLGHEEIDTIIPLIQRLQQQGMGVSGPYPADTVFTSDSLATADAILAMYHDQGLPVLKYSSFHDAINTTLGLPIIRTSVDHGTALSLAGTGKADNGSLRAAIKSAIQQVQSVKNFS